MGSFSAASIEDPDGRPVFFDTGVDERL